MARTVFKVTPSINSGQSATVDMGSKVNSASVAIQGFNMNYSSTDHHIMQIVVSAGISGTSGSQVTVNATAYMEDHSSNFAYGTATVLVIADVE